MRQTQVCYGKRIAEIRHEQGLTQIDLARRSGYSERLIRKAESGAMITSYAINDIAAALSVEGRTIAPSDLTCNPIQLAKSFIQAFVNKEREMVAQVADFIDENFILECVGNPQTTPFAGEWKGLEGLKQWLHQFYSVLMRPQKDFFQPELLVNDNTVIAWGKDWVQTPDFFSAPLWVALKFTFSEGQLVHLEKQFDTESMKKILLRSSKSTSLQ